MYTPYFTKCECGGACSNLYTESTGVGVAVVVVIVIVLIFLHHFPAGGKREPYWCLLQTRVAHVQTSVLPV